MWLLALLVIPAVLAGNDGDMQCPKCDRLFKTRRSLSYHVTRKHYDAQSWMLRVPYNLLALKCPRCNFCSNNWGNRKRHMNKAHHMDKQAMEAALRDEDQHLYPCSECANSFKDAGTRDQHLVYIHKFDREEARNTGRRVDYQQAVTKAAKTAKMPVDGPHPELSSSDLGQRYPKIVNLLNPPRRVAQPSTASGGRSPSPRASTVNGASGLISEERAQVNVGSNQRQTSSPEGGQASPLKIPMFRPSFPIEPLPFKCQKCDYGGNSKANLSRHMKDQHGADLQAALHRGWATAKTLIKAGQLSFIHGQPPQRHTAPPSTVVSNSVAGNPSEEGAQVNVGSNQGQTSSPEGGQPRQKESRKRKRASSPTEPA